jgi:arylsulfatase A-like enzyme
MKKLINLTLSITAAAITSGSNLTAQSAPPNLIVIMTDDQGYADVGFNGSKEIPTPNIDRIAAGGVVFTDGYVTYTVCSPSRAGFITGRYPQRFGYERNVAWAPNDPTAGLAVEETTLAAALRPAGYRSAVIGKWHMGSHENFHPLNRGFDEFFGHLGGGLRNFPEDLDIRDYREARNEPESYRTWVVHNREPVQTTGYLTDEFSREAVDFVRRQKAKPFFLFLAYNAPHSPLQATKEDYARFGHIKEVKRRLYASMVSAVDRGVGQILDTLDELNLADNTLIFFLSDNGGSNDNASSNVPLRGVKSNPWEGGFRVPFAARWPGVLPAGVTYTEPVSSLDIFATIAAANNLTANPDRPLDGVNLVPYVRGEKSGSPHSHIYLRMFDSGDYAMRRGEYKIVKPRNVETPRLFNVRTDIAESEEISKINPELNAGLIADYEAWNAQLVEPTIPGLNMHEWKKPQPPYSTVR